MNWERERDDERPGPADLVVQRGECAAHGHREVRAISYTATGVLKTCSHCGEHWPSPGAD